MNAELLSIHTRFKAAASKLDRAYDIKLILNTAEMTAGDAYSAGLASHGEAVNLVSGYVYHGSWQSDGIHSPEDGLITRLYLGFPFDRPMVAKVAATILAENGFKVQWDEDTSSSIILDLV